MSIKTLHSYTVSLDREVEETVTREENGQRISVTSKVKKAIPYTVLLKDPSRREKNELALFKDVVYGAAMRAGLVTKLEMQQRLTKADSFNPLSEDEDRNVAAMNARLNSLATEYIEISAKVTSTDALDPDNQKRAQLLTEYLALQKKVDDINVAYQSVFAHTAENHTQIKMLRWLILFLTYVQEEGQTVPRPLFPGTDFNAKDEKAAEMEDSQDALFVAAVGKLPAYWLLYLFGRANKPEDFARIDKEEAERAAAEAKMKAEEEARAAAVAKDAVPFDPAAIQSDVVPKADLTPEAPPAS